MVLTHILSWLGLLIDQQSQAQTWIHFTGRLKRKTAIFSPYRCAHMQTGTDPSDLVGKNRPICKNAVRNRLCMELHASSEKSPGLRGCEIEGGMRGTCEGHSSCFVGVQSGIVSSYHAKAGYHFDSCEIAGRWAWGDGKLWWVFKTLYSKNTKTLLFTAFLPSAAGLTLPLERVLSTVIWHTEWDLQKNEK